MNAPLLQLRFSMSHVLPQGVLVSGRLEPALSRSLHAKATAAAAAVVSHGILWSSAAPEGFKARWYLLLLCRLHDVIHADRRLYLVFEYLDLDLKKLMDGMPTFSSDHRLIKVGHTAVAAIQWQAGAAKSVKQLLG